MSKIPPRLITIVVVLLTAVNSANTANLTLRSSISHQANFEINLGEPFEVELFVDPEGESLVGVSIYLSFDDQFLELTDANPTLGGFQPIEAGELIPPTWGAFDNDTHGDPGNNLAGFQIDYVRLSIVSDDAVTEAGVVGRIRFRPIGATASTTISVDSDAGASRLTEATIITSEELQRQVAFSTVTPAQITVGGAPLITAPLPDITLLMGETDRIVELDAFVTDSNDPNDLLTWRATGNRNVSVAIDPDTHIATFTSDFGWAGEEEIMLTVTDPQGNAASAVIRIRVMSAPEIGELPPIRVRAGQEALPIDLNSFARDLDDPNLTGLTWARGQVPDGLTVNLSGNFVTIRGEAEQADTPIEFIATDADGNMATAIIFVTVGPSVSGPIVANLPDVIATSDGLISVPPAIELDLDLYLVDFDFEPAQIQWTTEGNVNVLAEIDPATHIPIFRSENGWTGTEELVFVATNPNNQRGTAMMMVTIIGAGAPPKLAEIPPLALSVNEVHTVDLKPYVFDLNSTPDQISWEVSGHEVVQISIDANGVATLLAPEDVMETMTLTAIDPDGNRDSTTLIVTAVEVVPPQIRELPNLRLKPNETLDAFDLDEFVTDPLTPAAEIQWTAEGFDPAHLTVEILPDHRVQFTAQPNWHGEVIVNFTATNRSGLTAAASIGVVGMAAPVVTFSDDSVELPERRRSNLSLDAHVEDADTPKDQMLWDFSLTPAGSGAISVTIDQPSRTAVLEAPAGSAGEYEITFTATDADGNMGQGIYRVRAIVVQKVPPAIAQISDIIFTNDASHTIELNALVTDGDTPLEELTWNAAGHTNIAVQIDARNRATFSAPTDYAGTEVIIFTVADPDQQSDSRPVNVTVKFPPKPPVIAKLPDIEFHQRQTHRALDLDDFITDEDTPLDQIRWSATGQVTISVEIDSQSHVVTFRSTTQDITKEEITFIAEDTDRQRARATATVSVVQAPPVTPPTLAELPELSIPLSEVGTKPVTLSLSEFVTDADTSKADLIWEVTDADAELAVEVDPESQVATFTPAEGFVGEKRLTFAVTDAEGQRAEGSLTFTVIDDRPQPPVIANLPPVVTFKGAFSDVILALDDYVSDPDTPDADLTWTSSTALNLTIVINPETHVAEITPNPGFLGEEAVTFTVTDVDDFTAEAQVQIKVLPPDPNAKPPVLVQSPSLTLEAGQVGTLDLDGLVSDEDTPDALIRWKVSGQEKIAITIDPNTRVATLSLTPGAQDFRGTETIALTATDADGKNGSTFLRVTVQDPPDRTPPTFEIYALPNPIQPEFLTITIRASEKLQAKPTVNVEDKFLSISTLSQGTTESWTGVHVLPKNFSGNVEIHVEGTDLAGLEGEGAKTFTADASLAAPATAPSVLNVSTYPNPAVNDAVWVECQIDRPTTLTVFVYTSDGELVRTMGDEEFEPVPDRLARRCRWDLTEDFRASLANGMYFCYGVAQNGNARRTHCWKMVISR
ncbi:MAG: Ig-like domain-containing protein [Candidatus Poribacteria bacterium]|nr:Ig-like domain-containing protein [Candidatus Poribacteria bacterium]